MAATEPKKTDGKGFGNLVAKYTANENKRKQETVTVEEYLNICKTDPTAYAEAHERLLKAFGDERLVDTSKASQEKARIHFNRTIAEYDTFTDFYGMEETIQRIAGFLKNAAMGLEERKQILYFLGPVGSAKSSLAERVKDLMEKYPIYVLCDEKEEMSPVFESPLGLFSSADFKGDIAAEYNIDERYMRCPISPWARKRLEEYGGDITKFKVRKVHPSRLQQLAIAKTEPGDDNNQDISALVGKVDISKLGLLPQTDPDAYSYSGALNRANQGVMEFVEMFKAPIKMLHPLLTATQEANYNGTENIGSLPYQGLLLAHSNEAEWSTFRNNKSNEAFIDRVFIIKVPYTTRASEEVKIYEKLLKGSDLKDKPCAPGTLRMLAELAVLTRLKEHENSNLYTKMKVYDGQSLTDEDKQAKPLQEYKDAAGQDEGMSGLSTRFAFKVLSQTFNYHAGEDLSADPVTLMAVLEQMIKREQFPDDVEAKYLDFIKTELQPKYADFLWEQISKAYVESYADFGQNLFERYVACADAWIENNDYKDPDTGMMFNREALEKELEKLEKPAGISNPRDFRNEVVKFSLRAQAKEGKFPRWDSYEKIAKVIKVRMFNKLDDLLPVISFGQKRDTETQKKHEGFLDRMVAQGYTEKQTRRLVEWYVRYNKNS
ncbi:MAG: PrkA family serine protein kinase [Alphaproteobacteria bacterium]|nr:PrkA family serine protein kinase [Alphaproteobacteria bacterium]